MKLTKKNIAHPFLFTENDFLKIVRRLKWPTHFHISLAVTAEEIIRNTFGF